MWKIPYICFLILILCPSWYRTIWVGLLCAVFVFFVMWVACRLRLRMVARAIRVCSDERLDQQIRIAHDLYDTMLQTIDGTRFYTDAALEKPDDSVQMRLALENLSMWLGQASEDGQAALNSLHSSTIENNNPHSKSKSVTHKTEQGSDE